MSAASPTTRRRSARPKLDAVAAEAVELARQALDEVTEPGQVGEHLRVEPTGDRLVTHVFECTMPGYRGWSWVVVLARASRAKAATVAETALLPGEDAILAPAWEPWSERLKPEDVGADDLLPYREDDERLEQGYEATGEEDEDRVALWELGLGRPRVLSPQGRSEAAERWLEGEYGPRPASRRGRKGTVPAHCTSCGFFTQLAGSLRGEFGVCTNEWSPADGRVVHLRYGCGAHSETGKEESTGREVPRGGAVVMDEMDVEYQQQPGADAPSAAAAEGSEQSEQSPEDRPERSDQGAGDQQQEESAAAPQEAEGGQQDDASAPQEAEGGQQDAAAAPHDSADASEDVEAEERPLRAGPIGEAPGEAEVTVPTVRPDAAEDPDAPQAPEADSPEDTPGVV